MEFVLRNSEKKEMVVSYQILQHKFFSNDNRHKLTFKILEYFQNLSNLMKDLSKI